MYLFYTPDITPPLYELPEEEARHCGRVLRLGPGDCVHLTDGRGNLYRAQIAELSPKRCAVRVVETIPEFEKRPYSLTVGVAPTKNIDRFEWFLEKATETGIDRIIPLDCDHSERRVIKHERQLRVITSAVKQSLKAFHPRLDEMTPFRQVVTEPFAGRKFIAHCRPDYPREFIGRVIAPGEDALVLVGPEGDFSPQEIESAMEAGFTAISLGGSRLRTETAALAVVSAVALINNM